MKQLVFLLFFVLFVNFASATNYYVAANGNDSYDGLAKVFDGVHGPWVHAPGMINCANTGAGSCGAVLLNPDDSVIFRGGDTWHFGVGSVLLPHTGGTWDYATYARDGTSGHNIYLGVDQTWFNAATCGVTLPVQNNGTGWCRPIFNSDNPPSTSRTLTGCTYQNAVGSNNMVKLSNLHHITFDNFEMLGICSQAPGSPNAYDDYISFGFATIDFKNLYIHGWSHKQFDPYVEGSCINNPGTAICANIHVFDGGSVVMGSPGSTYDHIVVDGADSDGVDRVCYCDFFEVKNSVFRNAGNIITRQPHVMHDVLIENWRSHDHHTNVVESVSDADYRVHAMYNINIRNVSNTSDDNDPQVGIWPYPCASAGSGPGAYCTGQSTLYLFNITTSNIGHDSIGLTSLLNVSQNGEDNGNVIAFNNTFEVSIPQFIVGCSNDDTYKHPWTDVNNLYITDFSTQYAYSNCTFHTASNNLLQNHATANAQTNGVSGGFYPHFGAATVNAGTSISSYCSALATAAATDSTLSDAATACLKSTGGGPVYDPTAHMVTSNYSITPVTRPASPDIGAYQIGGPISSFTRDGDVNIGGSTILRWTTSATSCSLNNGIGAVATTGTKSVSPKNPVTVYVLTCDGYQASLTVMTGGRLAWGKYIPPPPPVPSFVKEHDSFAYTGTFQDPGYQHALTVATTIPVGHQVIIVGFGSSFTINDPTGNTFNCSSYSSNGQNFVCTAFLTNQMTAGTLITLTYTQALGAAFNSLIEFSNTTAVDQAYVGRSQYTNDMVTPTITTTFAQEILLSTFAIPSGTVSPALQSPAILIRQFTFNGAHFFIAFQPVSTVGSYFHEVIGTGFDSHDAAIVSYH